VARGVDRLHARQSKIPRQRVSTKAALHTRGYIYHFGDSDTKGGDKASTGGIEVDGNVQVTLSVDFV